MRTDYIWDELSKVYNMPDVPDKAKSIIGDLMLKLDESSAQPNASENTCEIERKSNDMISRADAIDAFNTNIDELVVAGKENADSVEKYLNRVIDKIKELPSARPEPKTGKWLRSGSCIFPYECDECGDTNERPTPFCPNCGADMGGEQND